MFGDRERPSLVSARRSQPPTSRYLLSEPSRIRPGRSFRRCMRYVLACRREPDLRELWQGRHLSFALSQVASWPAQKRLATRQPHSPGWPTRRWSAPLVPQGIAWRRSTQVHGQWLLYHATGTAHAPHHAPKDWIAKYKGQFDQGWDKVREETLARQIKLGVVPSDTKLTPRPKEIPAWDTLSADQKRLYARMMEVYAGALSHADYNIGRVLDAIEASDQRDNTLVIFMMGDNSASAEGSLQGTTNEVGTAGNGVKEDLPFLLSMIDELGGPRTYNHYPVGWAHAMDTPMQWTKQIASHFGGTRNGMVISWPARIKDRG